MKNNLKTIKENYFKGSQSMSFEGIYKLNDYKIKVEIKKDSYDAQSYGRIWIWKNLEWSFIASIPYSQLNVVLNGIYYGSEITSNIKTIFEKDAKILIQDAINILI